MNDLYGSDPTQPKAPAFTKPMPKMDPAERRKKGGLLPYPSLMGKKKETRRGGLAG